MHTRCPHCDTVFRITPEALAAAHNRVRCGNCLSVFDGRAGLVDESRPAPRPQPRTATRQALPASEHYWLEDERAPPRAGWAATLGWTLGSLALLGSLVVQYAWFLRADLARHAVLRPWLQELCKVAECELPPQRDLSQIRILERDLRHHPEHDAALLVNALIVNQASFAQPLPQLELTLSDLRGEVVAARRFLPGEYLAGSASSAAEMAPGNPVHVVIELVDPGSVTGYRFRFF